MLVAFDLDGTLHSHDGVDDDAALGELADYLTDRGVFTVLATGRSLGQTLELRQIMESLPVDAIVANCGAQVYFRQQANFVPDTTFSTRPGATITESDRSALGGFFSGNASVWLQEDRHQFPGKLSFYVRAEAIKSLRALISEARMHYPAFEYLISYNPEDRGYHYFDVHPKDSTKLAGLLHIAGVVDVAESEIVYFGDNGNDLPCIRAFERTAMVDTYLDDLRKDTEDFDWSRVLKLQYSGAAPILSALKEMD